MEPLQGYLFKQGEKGIRKAFRKRWFVYSQNKNQMFYYKIKDKKDKKGGKDNKDKPSSSSSSSSSSSTTGTDDDVEDDDEEITISEEDQLELSQQNTSDGYEGPDLTGLKASGAINLADIRSVVFTGYSSANERYGFIIETKQRTYNLQGEQEDSCRRWVNRLNKLCDEQNSFINSYTEGMIEEDSELAEGTTSGKNKSNNRESMRFGLQRKSTIMGRKGTVVGGSGSRLSSAASIPVPEDVFVSKEVHSALLEQIRNQRGYSVSTQRDLDDIDQLIESQTVRESPPALTKEAAQPLSGNDSSPSGEESTTQESLKPEAVFSLDDLQAVALGDSPASSNTAEEQQPVGIDQQESPKDDDMKEIGLGDHMAEISLGGEEVSLGSDSVGSNEMEIVDLEGAESSVDLMPHPDSVAPIQTFVHVKSPATTGGSSGGLDHRLSGTIGEFWGNPQESNTQTISPPGGQLFTSELQREDNQANEMVDMDLLGELVSVGNKDRRKEKDRKSSGSHEAVLISSGSSDWSNEGSLKRQSSSSDVMQSSKKIHALQSRVSSGVFTDQVSMMSFGSGNVAVLDKTPPVDSADDSSNSSTPVSSQQESNSDTSVHMSQKKIDAKGLDTEGGIGNMILSGLGSFGLQVEEDFHKHQDIFSEIKLEIEEPTKRSAFASKRKTAAVTATEDDSNSKRTPKSKRAGKKEEESGNQPSPQSYSASPIVGGNDSMEDVGLSTPEKSGGIGNAGSASFNNGGAMGSPLPIVTSPQASTSDGFIGGVTPMPQVTTNAGKEKIRDNESWIELSATTTDEEVSLQVGPVSSSSSSSSSNEVFGNEEGGSSSSSSFDNIEVSVQGVADEEGTTDAGKDVEELNEADNGDASTTGNVDVAPDDSLLSGGSGVASGAGDRQSMVIASNEGAAYTHSGILFKMDAKGIKKGWKSRWFKLDEGTIEYYKTEKAPSPQGTIDVRKIEKIQIPDELSKSHIKGKMNYPFDVTIPGRVYKLSASNEADRQKWLEMLEMARTLLG